MPRLTATILFFLAMSLFPHQTKAETYWLKIEQTDINNPKIFLQTCSFETMPCTFMMPVQLESGTNKNIAAVIRLNPPYVHLQFFWDQSLLKTNMGEDYATFIPEAPDSKVEPRTIGIYAPLPPEQTSQKNIPVLKYSDTPIATVKVTTTMTEK